MERIQIEPISMAEVEDLCQKWHGYGGAGAAAVHSFGVIEGTRVVAAFAWQPPPYGAAKKAAPSAPHGCLSLSRMVAVPAAKRRLRHISKALRRIMRDHIDRTRWPVLVTYSDPSLGHTGHVYKCSGWLKEGISRRPYYVVGGRRVSSYKNGRHEIPPGAERRITLLTRWVHRQRVEGARLLPGEELEYMERHGWVKVPVHGKTWASGRQAHKVVRR